MPEDWFAPSVSSPFFRRFFGNESERDRRELHALYTEVAAQPSPYTPEQLGYTIATAFLAAPEPINSYLCCALDEIIRAERYMFECPPPPATMTLKEFADYQNFLRQRQYFLSDHDSIAGLFADALMRIFKCLGERLPVTEDETPFTIPLVNALPEPGALISGIHKTLVEDLYRERGLFVGLTDRLYVNLCYASGVEPYKDTKRPYKQAAECDLPLDRLTETYLAGTPFLELFQQPVPLKFTHKERFSHTHIVGGTNAGKTTLLEYLILHDLAYDTPSLIVIDSQGDLLRKLTHLAIFDPDTGKHGRRFLYITPRDIEHPPALNVFDVNRARLGNYDQATKEQVIAGVIQTFDYLFAGLLGADLTAKQNVFFKYVARLMLSLPETMGRNATILDMLRLMEDAEPYRAAIETLPPIQRNFFEQDFLNPKNTTYKQTKEQVRYRLMGIIENPTLARLFTSTTSKIDLFDEMNSGTIIFVDTAKDFLKGSHSHFGRIIISLVLQAALERAAIPEWERKPAFLIVDEAASYFDGNIDDLLTDTRKYKVGCVFAHQYLDQAAPSLRASLAANCSIKFASGVSTSDARAMATDMRTTPDFILKQPSLQFACHIRNVTPQAVSIPVYPGLPERLNQLTPEQYERMRDFNRSRVSISPQEEAGTILPIGNKEDAPGGMAPQDGSGADSKASEDLSAPSDEW
jgi:hypothetical protein